MGGLDLIAIILLGVGFEIGLKLPIWIQGIILVADILFLSSSWVKGQELGALIWFLLGIAVIAGMIVGDLVWLIWYSAEAGFHFDPGWLIKP